MATYTYQCTNDKCKDGEELHVFTVTKSMSDDSVTKCDKCKKSTTVTQLISSNGFILKGRGWFKSGGY